MNLFGLSITRTKATPPPGTAFTTPSSRGGWIRILEPFSGAWQRNIEATPESVLTFHAVYGCVTLIATDIAKMPISVVEQDGNGIWNPVQNPAYTPVLRKPNHYQDRIQFITHWMLSKLIHGNTYVLKQRDARGVVSSMFVLDPTLVTALVAPNGEVFYRLGRDDLSQVDGTGEVVVPAAEIIHDRMPPLYHPLVGVSPLTACYGPALQALRGQLNASRQHLNGSRPGGILTYPTFITEEQERQIKLSWEQNFGGDNQGRVAVLGADLKYQDLGMLSNIDMQLIEQLKLSGEAVCTAYHVPPFKVGIGSTPPYNQVEALNILYYGDCLQYHVESIESLLDRGLGMAIGMGTEFDEDSLLRMDSSTRSTAAKEALGGGMSPNEARSRFFSLGPVRGGESPYLQQQNFSLEALAKRDAQDDPFATKATPSRPTDEPTNTPPPSGAKHLKSLAYLAVRQKLRAA